MHEYRPHSFDTHGFLFGVKCLLTLAIILTGVRYGSVLASERLFTSAQPPLAAASAAPVATPAFEARRITVDAPPPAVTADGFVVADVETGDIFAAKNELEPYPIASISKLLTALVARDLFPAGATTTFLMEDRKNTEGSPGSINRTDTFVIDDLYFALLLESNNSVANTLARTYGKDEFVRLLLRKAHAIGMDTTLMRDPSGLSERNSASALDVLALTRTVYSEDAGIFDITRTPSFTLVAESGRKYHIPNFNVFSKRPDFVGGKTGYTDEARETFTSIFETSINGHSVRLAIVVLHSDDRKKDVEKLLAWFTSSARITL